MKDIKFIPALTGIRAVAVYMIFFKHLNRFSPTQQSGPFLLTNQFYTFLTFFFVLSGFLIYYRYHEIGSLKKKDIYNYFINRISRVFPILIILISITFLLGYKDGLYSGKEAVKLYLLNISLAKGFSSAYLLSGIGPSWSMSVEELFYILSPFIFFYTTNFFSLVKFVVIFYATGLLITFLFSLHPFQGFFSDNLFMFNYTFFGRVFEFACGIFLAMAVKGKIKNPLLKLSGKLALYAGLIIITIALILLYLISNYLHIKIAIESWQGIAVNNLLMPFGITLLFYGLIVYKSLLQRFLSSKIMVELGNATYSFYLLHTTFVLSYIYKFISANIWVTFITMIIIAYIFHRLVEQPLTVFFRKKLSAIKNKS